MKQNNDTKRALLTSVLSMILCVTMLVGSTFAWFTDSISSGNNKIIAGNLDMQLIHKNAKGQEGEVTQDTELFTNKDGNKMVWEPGAVTYENFTIKNIGSLAFGYTFSINVGSFNEMKNSSSLKDVLKIAVIEGHFNPESRENLSNICFEDLEEANKKIMMGELASNNAPKEYSIIIKWEPSENDNKLNKTKNNTTSDGKLLFIDLGIKVEASQLSHEKDGFGTDYDEEAWDDTKKEQEYNDLIAQGYEPAQQSNFNEIIEDNEKVVLNEDIKVDDGTKLLVKNDTVIDFNHNEVIRGTLSRNALTVAGNNSKVTLQNADFISEKGGVIVRVEGADTLTVKDSHFICEATGSTGNKIFQFTESQENVRKVIFENCTFDTGYVGFEGFDDITNYNVEFKNCDFKWDDKNGSSFIQAGSYAKGNYSFKNCSFEYTNWWSGDLIQIDNPKAKSNVSLENITVKGSGNKKPYVVSGYSVVGKKNLTVEDKGTSTYVYNDEPLDWHEIYWNK